MPYLPEELLVRIFDELRMVGEDQTNVADKAILHTLRNATAASKTLRRAAQPAFFRTINLRVVDYERIPLLLDQIVTQPSLGSMIRRVNIESFDTEKENVHHSAGYAYPLPRTERKVSNATIKYVQTLHASSAWKKRASKELEEGREDANFSLLVCLCCASVEVIDAGMPYSCEFSLFVAMFQDALDGYSLSAVDQRGKAFASLHTVKFHHADTEMATDLAKLGPVLQQPSVRTLQGHALEFPSRESDLSARLTCSLVHIELEFSILDADGMRALLMMCPRLQSFKIHWGESCVGNVEELDFEEMGRVLSTHGLHLQRLLLDTTDAFQDESAGLPIGSLCSLEDLQDLTLQFKVLFGEGEDDDDEDSSKLAEPGYLVNTLPSSLQALTLVEPSSIEDHETADERLLELMTSSWHQELKLVRVLRVEPFLADLVGSGWSMFCFKNAIYERSRWFVLERDGSVAVPGLREEPLVYTIGYPNYVSRVAVTADENRKAADA
ncbi:hypothetical protein LTR62_003981 [Meristemomyces frigidus]|uniref:Uncharacterized protein n=1 Tax=Meristemomyces frigidus TaxID=1508187 RepID=A0AAN7YTT8_9PEZI|nr:hypothetical protein LTR62_003981 [Meristemomyces frigidus]